MRLLQDGNDGAQYTELSTPDYLRIAQVFVSLGIRKIRLAGGEPLLRKDLVALIRELSEFRTAPDGNRLDIALTTMGICWKSRLTCSRPQD